MSASPDRRSFLQSSVALGAGGLAFLDGLPAVAAADAKPDPALVRLDSGIEPLVRLLEETVRELKGEEIVPEIHSALNLSLDIGIPNEYISDENQRLRAYRQIANASSAERVPLSTPPAVARKPISAWLSTSSALSYLPCSTYTKPRSHSVSRKWWSRSPRVLRRSASNWR